MAPLNSRSGLARMDGLAYRRSSAPHRGGDEGGNDQGAVVDAPLGGGVALPGRVQNGTSSSEAWFSEPLVSQLAGPGVGAGGRD